MTTRYSSSTTRVNNIVMRTKLDYTVTETSTSYKVSIMATIQASSNVANKVLQSGFGDGYCVNGDMWVSKSENGKSYYWNGQYDEWREADSGGYWSTIQVGKWGPYTLAAANTWYDVCTSGYMDFTVAKSTNVAGSITFRFGVQGWYSGDYDNIPYVEDSFSLTVSKTSYAVTYNANGGSGTTASQWKIHGEALTLRANGFTRSGYAFKRWNTNTTDTGTAYNASASYTGNAALALYAIWNRTVTFHANGGTGAPAAQTAVATSAITLSATKPTLDGYSFKRWNTNTSDTGTAYNSGSSYPANSPSITIYAIWNRTVTYNANGGGTAPAPQTALKTSAMTLASAMTREGYTFMRWNTKADGSGTDYQPGATYAANNPSVTLYAIWWKNPTVNVPTMTRCDAQGIADECGGYVKVSFGWAVDAEQGGGTPADVRLSVQLTGGGASFSYNETQAGASGSLTRVMGDGTLSPTTTYTASATAADANSTATSTAVLDVSQSYFMPRVTRAVATLTNASGQGNCLGKYVSVTVNYEVYGSASQDSTRSISMVIDHGGQTASEEVEDVSLVGSQTWLFGPYGYDSFDPHGDYQVGELTVSDNFNSTTAQVGVSTTGYVNPIISGISAYRVNPVDHGGTTVYEESDDGTSLGVDIGWYVYGAQGQQPVITIDVIEMMTGDTVVTRTYDDWNVTEASSRIFIEAQEGDIHPAEGLLDTGKQYLVTATLSDAYSAVVTSAKATISEAVSNSFFTMDFLAGGHGVGIGKPSTRPAFDVGMQAQFDKPIQVAEQVSLPVYTFSTLPAQADIPAGPAIVLTEDDYGLYFYDGDPTTN